MARKKKWYEAGLCFTCTQCGNCCSGDPGYVWATKEEIRSISAFLGRGDGWLDKRDIRRVGLRYSLTERPNGDCTFLIRENGKALCAIYSVRPRQCRSWPFWNEILSSPKAWADAHEKCPGMDNGTHYNFVQIEARRTHKQP